MSAVSKCPVVFVVRNNGYAISTPTSEQYSGDGIASRGVGYGIPAIRVDGNDILAVYAASVEARNLAIKNNTPVIIEAMTYRMGAHSTSDDPTAYRTSQEEEMWRQKDPIERMKKWLLDKNWWSEEQDDQMRDHYKKEILAALKSQEKRQPPSLDHLVSDVYQTSPAHLKQQYSDLLGHIDKYPDHYLPNPKKGQDSYNKPLLKAG